MMTKRQIQKSKSSIQTMFTTANSGQLSENCVFFDEILPGIHFSLSLIKNNPIVDNENFDVKNWYETKPDDFKKQLSQLFMNSLIPTGDLYKQRKDFPDSTLARVFTIDPLKNNEDIISYLFQIQYKPGSPIL